MSEMKGAVRCNAITMQQLAAQEKHGKREDRISQLRVVRDADPLVHRTLDLRDAYDHHMDGVKQNSGAKRPVLHFIVRFPPELLSGPAAGRFSGSKIERQKMMLAQAVRFVQDTHGGDAVFAARLDTDETGETIADVFAVPRYEKRTKRTRLDEKGVVWASSTRFGKELAEKHQDEIHRRHPKAKGKLTSPRMVGIALQSEFADWFCRTNGFRLAPKVEKEGRAPDRLEKEAYDAIQNKIDELERRERNVEIREKNVEAAVTGLVELVQDTAAGKLIIESDGRAKVARQVGEQGKKRMSDLLKAAFAVLPKAPVMSLLGLISTAAGWSTQGQRHLTSAPAPDPREEPSGPTF